LDLGNPEGVDIHRTANAANLIFLFALIVTYAVWFLRTTLMHTIVSPIRQRKFINPYLAPAGPQAGWWQTSCIII